MHAYIIYEQYEYVSTKNTERKIIPLYLMIYLIYSVYLIYTIDNILYFYMTYTSYKVRKSMPNRGINPYENLTTIQLKKKTHADLQKLGLMGESFDQLVARLIQSSKLLERGKIEV
jgi:hypothetical protein